MLVARLWKRVLFFAVLILAIRICLFHTETSWRFCLTHLEPRDIGETGFREHDFLKVQAQHYGLDRHFPGVECLAVGSSQTGFLFHQYSQKHPERLRYISLGGMGPFDLWLFRDHVTAFRPKRVLLYLSELDMSNKYYVPYLPNLRIAPGQGLSILPLWLDMRRFGLLERPLVALYEMLTLELSPEIRYNYISKAFVDKLLGRSNSRQGNMASQFEGVAPEEVVAWQTKLFDYFQPEIIPFSRFMLEKYLDWCGERRYEVIILEGQLQPGRGGERIAGLHRAVNKVLQEVSAARAWVRFIPKSRLYPLREDEFNDFYHMTMDAGERFVTKLLQDLDAEDGRAVGQSVGQDVGQTAGQAGQPAGQTGGEN